MGFLPGVGLDFSVKRKFILSYLIFEVKPPFGEIESGDVPQSTTLNGKLIWRPPEKFIKMKGTLTDRISSIGVK